MSAIRSTFSDIVTCCVRHFDSYTCDFLGIASAASLFLLDDVPVVVEAADWFEIALGVQRSVLTDVTLASFDNK